MKAVGMALVLLLSFVLSLPVFARGSRRRSSLHHVTTLTPQRNRTRLGAKMDLPGRARFVSQGAGTTK